MHGSVVGRSLERQLILRIVAIFLLAFIAVFSGFVYRVFSAVEDLNEIALQTQAKALADHLAFNADGTVRLSLPDRLRMAYAKSADTHFYAVLDSDGRPALSSNAVRAADLRDVLLPALKPGRFLFTGDDGVRDAYVGYLQPAGGDWIMVAQRRDPSEEGILASVFEEYIEGAAWWVLAIMVLAAVMCVWTVRSMFRPLAQEAGAMRDIDIDSPPVDLPVARFPSEIAPFIAAVNAAFARIRGAYWLQQQFISDAAHQIRTPLAVLMARLEAATAPIEGKTVIRDVARVNRTVGQLLKLTRLDAKGPDVSGRVDLVALARDVVGVMAPYVARQQRVIELQTDKDTVAVRGDYYALFDALQNLIENAVQASPVGGVIRVAVSGAGAISVLDRGCGISEAEKPHLFDRFWRGRQNPAPGSGLGLSIVRRIADAHGGCIFVEDRKGGGSVFTLKIAPIADDGH